MDTVLLFSYGSNNPRQLTERIGATDGMVGAYASGHKRVFRGWSTRWGGGVASLVKDANRPAYGYAAEITTKQLSQMDRFEGVGLGKYDRKEIDVIIPDLSEDETYRAIAYVSTSHEFNQPSQDYLEAVAKTISAFWHLKGGVSGIKVE